MINQRFITFQRCKALGKEHNFLRMEVTVLLFKVHVFSQYF